jgi:hypothetical protein
MLERALGQATLGPRPFEIMSESERGEGPVHVGLAQQVTSVVSWRPARCQAPTARLRRVAIARGPDLVRTVELSSR